MIKLIVFIVMVLIAFVLFIIWGIKGLHLLVVLIQKNNVGRLADSFKRTSIILAVAFAIIIGMAWISELKASTPAIKDASGKIVEGSIAELKKIELNGRKEWITIRGNNKNAPILLFLAGGPGGSQLASTRYDLSELEKHFVVVNWDQPGSAKSYQSINTDKLTTQIYIDDGLALTEYLCEEFNQQKIYLVGESWGSALAIFLADARPDRFAGVIGAGQMVDFGQTDIMNYNTALDIAREKGDTKLVTKLEKQGPPLYTGNIVFKSMPYLNYLNEYMMTNPETTGGFHTIRDVTASEYGIMDSIYYACGLVKTYNTYYPKLYDVDLRKSYTNLKVPVYFFLGRYDVNAPTSLVEDYYDKLQAPEKEIVWFEHSGHTPWQYETSLFCKELLRVFHRE